MRAASIFIAIALLLSTMLPAQAASQASSDEALPPHRIFALNRQGAAAPLSFEQLIAELAPADVVICGEYHDDPATHQIELALLEAYAASKVPDLKARKDMNWASAYIDRKFALSMEMFERDVQAVIDNYVSGNPHSPAAEQDFLRASRPWGNYATDYRPLVEFCREHKLQVIAANPPTSLARRVAKEGVDAVLSTLGDEERGWLAQNTTAPRDAYWERFLSFMGGGGSSTHGGGMTEEQIYRYYQAQCAKDDTMAGSIWGYLGFYSHDLNRAPCGVRPQRGAFVFHVNGSFHSDYGYGVAQRVREREMTALTIAIRPVADFTPVSSGGSLDPQGETLADGTPVADFVIFVPAPDPQ